MLANNVFLLPEDRFSQISSKPSTKLSLIRSHTLHKYNERILPEKIEETGTQDMGLETRDSNL